MRRIGIIASSVQSVQAPTVTINSVTNFNQDRATFNATVNPNGATTDVKFQYSTDGSTWTDTSSITGLTGGSQSFYINKTGLSVGTLYYVRAIGYNSAGTGVSSNTTFTTWSLKTYINTTAGNFYVTIPSITPTGESAIAPTIYEMLLYGGGGGANYSGGGGGGYRLFASHTSSVAGTHVIGGYVGAGGAAGNGGGGTGSATAGGNTYLEIGSSSWTGGGGGAGQHPGSCGASCGGRGGTVGSGTNGANIGGCTTYGYYYFTGNYVYVCQTTDKFGNCTSGYYDYNQPIYAWDCNYYSGGGGGGTDSVGGDYVVNQGSNSHWGGNGGTGGGAYGLRGGNGGGGMGTQLNGSAGGFSAASGTIVGTGGSQFSAGLAGGITFKYYGP